MNTGHKGWPRSTDAWWPREQLSRESLEPAVCNGKSLRRGCRAGAFQQVPTSVLSRLAGHLSSQASLAQHLSIGSVSAICPPARCRGMRAQRDDTSEVEPGSGNSGDHTFPWSQWKGPGGKMGQGWSANQGPLALSWKKTTEKDRVRAPKPPAPRQHTCRFRIQRQALRTFCLQRACFASPRNSPSGESSL